MSNSLEGTGEYDVDMGKSTGLSLAVIKCPLGMV